MSQFGFIGPVERDGRFSIHMSSIDTDRIRDDADRAISQEPDELGSEFEDVCHKDLDHSQTLMDALRRKCVRD